MPGPQGVKGIPCIWHIIPELVDRFQLPPDVPESITDRVDKAARRRVQRARKGAAAAAAAGRDAAASERALKAEAAAIAAAAFAQSDGHHDDEMVSRQADILDCGAVKWYSQIRAQSNAVCGLWWRQLPYDSALQLPHIWTCSLFL